MSISVLFVAFFEYCHLLSLFVVFFDIASLFGFLYSDDSMQRKQLVVDAAVAVVVQFMRLLSNSRFWIFGRYPKPQTPKPLNPKPLNPKECQHLVFEASGFLAGTPPALQSQALNPN